MATLRSHGRPVLLLDVMDTLVWDPAFTVLPALFGTDLQGHYAEKDKEAFHMFERGELDEDGFRRRYFLDGRDWDMAAVKRALLDHYRWMEGMRDLVRDLVHRGFQLHAMSNYSSWYAMVEQACGLSEAGVAPTFLSYRMGVRKPDPRIYLEAARHLGVQPGACLFVDDRRKNVRGARAVGMPATRFTSAAALRRLLTRFDPTLATATAHDER